MGMIFHKMMLEEILQLIVPLPPGTTFSVGSTEVQCIATDAAGNTAASFTVTVNPIVTCDGETATIVGTNGDESLTGTEGRDVIAGLGGIDEINGLGGDDLLCGDDGNDVTQGDAGDDDMFGRAGDDSMHGDAGNDVLNSVDSVVDNDNLDGGAGTDTCTSDPDPEVNCEAD